MTCYATETLIELNYLCEPIMDDCPVCMENKVCIKFPAECGHILCINCTTKIIFRNEHYYYISRVPFGCAPCPNDCDNPSRGIQCTCEEYEAVIDEWEVEFPELYSAWAVCEYKSIREGMEDKNTSIGSGKCPMCRKIFDEYLYETDSDYDSYSEMNSDYEDSDYI